MGDMGLLGVTADEEYGGLGKGYLDHVIVMEEVRCPFRLAGLAKVDGVTIRRRSGADTLG